MSKNKDFLKGLDKDSLKQVGQKASAAKNTPDSKPEKRKMFRFGEKAHRIAKAVCGIEGSSIQSYIDNLVIEDAKKRHPEVLKQLFPEE